MATRILVVDDDPSIVDVYRDILTDEGWLVDVGDLEQLATGDGNIGRPDVILLDWMLGHQPEGDKVVRRLKADPTTRHIPIIVCTVAVTTITAAEPELTAYGIPILTKPFQIEDSLSLLRTTVRK